MARLLSARATSRAGGSGVAAQQLERAREALLRRLEVALLVGQGAHRVERARQLVHRRGGLPAEDRLGARKDPGGLRKALEVDVDRAQVREDLGHRELVRPALALLRGERLLEQARRAVQVAQPPGDAAERVLQPRLDQRLVGELARDPLAAELDDLAHRDLAPLRTLRIGLFEEVDEELDDAVGRAGLAIRPVRRALEIDGEALGMRAGALLAHREEGDDREDDGQQGEGGRERDDLEPPPAQALRLVEQQAQPLETLLRRRAARRNRVLEILHQARELGIDAVFRQDRQAAVLGDAHQELRQRFARVGRPPGQQLLQEDAEREEIARFGELLARGLLRAHVEDRPDDRPLLGERRRERRAPGTAPVEGDRALGVECGRRGCGLGRVRRRARPAGCPGPARLRWSRRCWSARCRSRAPSPRRRAAP